MNELDNRLSIKESLKESLEDSLRKLLDRVIFGLSLAKERNDRIDITEVAYDVLTQDPHLRTKVINTQTLTGQNLDDLEYSDRFYLKINKKVWLFSLEELNNLLNLQESLVITNPYTLEPFDEETINSIKRRIKYNTELVDHRIDDPEEEQGGDGRSAFSEDREDREDPKDRDDRDQSDTDSLLTADTDEVDIPRNDSFNVSHKMTEFLHRVSHLGCYPDINAFKQLKWEEIVEFVKRLLTDWPDLMSLGSTTLSVGSVNGTNGPMADTIVDYSRGGVEGESERRKLERILNRRTMTESGNPAIIIHEDQKTIVRFLTRLVTQNDNNDSSRALLFTTELSSYLTQLNQLRTEAEAASPDSRRRRRAELQPEETYESLLARLRAQPDNETFIQQVRFIIEHIVEMNTYSLSNSLSSGGSASTDASTSTDAAASIMDTFADASTPDA